MMIIPIIIAILGPLLFLAIVAGIVYLIIQKKNNIDNTDAHKNIHFIDIVTNFFSFSLLITNIVSVIAIIFSIVDKIIPDDLARESYYEISNSREALHSSVSLLVITLPALVILSVWMRKRSEKMNEENGPVRRFTIGAIIIGTCLTAAGSVFSVIYQFLEGDLTTRFLYKVLSVLVIAIVVGLYYRAMFKFGKIKYAYPIRIVGFGSVVALCAIGIILTGSPSKIRKEKFDERRLSDLSQIQSQILSYWQSHKALPIKLSDISDPISQMSVPTDPKTKESYKYEIVKQSEVLNNVVSEASFKICANFEAERVTKERYEGVEKQISISSESFDSYFPGNNSPFWDHKIGEKCFERTINPKIHSIREPMPVSIIQ